jgi:hypothetical protein
VENIDKTLKDITLEMLNLNASEYTETKNKLTYLSWANALKEALKIDSSFTYSITKNEEGIPVFGNSKLGYMVYTTVTFKGNTKECWLPVMDGANKPMKDEPYEYTTKYNGTKNVDSINMFDVNKTVMRCLTKNLAMFGLGLYIYAGEDLPEQIEEPMTSNQLKRINILIGELGVDTSVKEEKEKIYKWLKVKSLKTLGADTADSIIEKLKTAKKQKEDKK